ncbi:MAG TPA: hypothetical protein VNM68_07925 [Candidatus Polarisedimenticolia bacterium]|nr:hypothetical protein [Candidatus Polarisedimenticolia bacterium]
MILPKSVLSQGGKSRGRNPHGVIVIPCEDCHTATSWKPIRGIPEFDHNRTRFPLRGMHEKVECTQCHTSLVFKNAGTRCADCHADLHRGQFGTNCERCHTVKGWDIHTEELKQHSNRFPLLGGHAMLECAACHKGEAVGQFTGLSTECLSCHAADYPKALNPDHKASGFPTTCESCHSADTWYDAVFDHLKFTGYALTGAHATLPCTACHIGGRFKGTPADCYSCHTNDYNGTNNPPHAQAGFAPTLCSTCHDTSSWLNARFDHNTQTSFPLIGKHINVACNQCHINGKFAGTPTDCASCHMADYNGTNNPQHAQAGFAASACATCHSPMGWDQANFNHAQFFALTNGHANLQCTQCHTSGNYADAPTTCDGCHMAQYNSTNNPPHAQAGFAPTICSTCHDTIAWTDGKFDHNTQTAFPLTGKHIGVPCLNCHTNGVYKGLSTDCASCHMTEYNGTTNPSHAQAGFAASACATCHTTAGWDSANFNHSQFFPLTNGHANLQCTQCHIGGNYANAPTTCYGCHAKDYNSTATISGVPNHVTANFPQDCTLCHNTSSWLNATFDHNTTKFPLTGAHVTVPCATCHTDNYAGTLPTTCYGCHQKDYTNTATIAGVPNHVTGGFPQDCTMCHTTSTWLNATFNHNNTPFPLTGAHVSVPCNQCHIGGVYAGTPTDCYSCHKADYQGTTNPNHTAAGFPTTCATCHTTTSWLGATFNHTWFPLNHGNANGVCSTCHTNPNDFSVFQCTNCHTAAQTNPKHLGVSGYVYNSVNCYQCHKNGSAGG